MTGASRGEVVHGLRFADLPGRAGELELHLPQDRSEPCPVLLWTAGSGWLSDHGTARAAAVAAELVELGVAVVAYGIRSSSQATYPAQLYDAKAAVRWVRAHAERFGLDPDRVVAGGYSSGGWAASMLGLTSERPEWEGDVGISGPSSRVQGVVDLFGPTDLAAIDSQMLPGALEEFAIRNTHLGASAGHGGPGSPESRLVGATIDDEPELARSASPLSFVSAGCPPFLIAHGSSDRFIPPGQSELLFAAVRAAGADAVIYRVADHGHDLGLLDATPGLGANVGRTAGPVASVMPDRLSWDAVGRFVSVLRRASSGTGHRNASYPSR